MNIELDLNNLKILRKETGLGIIICKKALLQANNDLLLAQKFLYKEQIKYAKKKLYNKSVEKVSFKFYNNFIRIEVQLNCQTDFVARCEAFYYLAEILAINRLLYEKSKYINFDNIPVSKICNVKKSHIFFLQNYLLLHISISKILKSNIKILEEKKNLIMNSSNIRKYLQNENSLDIFLLKQISKFGENIKVRKIKIHFSIGDRGI
jgi:translation elongation factor EF-Ts